MHSCLLLLAMLAWHFACGVGLAQEVPQPQASLVIVNAVPGTKNLFINFDNQSIWPPGFTPGQSTSAVMFPAGRKRVKLECEGYAASEVPIDMAAGSNCAMVVYPGEEVADGPDRGKRKLGVFMPSPHPAGAKGMSGVRWKIILVGSRKSAEVEVNGRKLLLSPLQAAEISPGAAGVEVKYQGKALLGVSPEEAAQYIVVVFPSDKDLAAALLTHPAFKIPSG